MQKWCSLSFLLMIYFNGCAQDKNQIQFFDDTILDSMLAEYAKSTEQDLDIFLQRVSPQRLLSESESFDSSQAVSIESPKLHLIHKIKKEYKCPTCHTVCANNSNLKRHEKLHTGQYIVYSCLICNKKFGEKYNLDVHMRIHNEEKPYKCAKCPKCFTQKSHLQDHQLIHEPDPGFWCLFCDHKCKLGRNMIKHVKKMHADEIGAQ